MSIIRIKDLGALGESKALGALVECKVLGAFLSGLGLKSFESCFVKSVNKRDFLKIINL